MPKARWTSRSRAARRGGQVPVGPGLVASGAGLVPYARVGKGEAIYTRDLLVAIPGFPVAVEPAGKNVSLRLWGNLPELSDSPVRESAVILHDSKSFDLDLTLVRGRIVITNTRAKGHATVWLRAGGCAADPGTSRAIPSGSNCTAVGPPGRRSRAPPKRARARFGCGRSTASRASFQLKGEQDRVVDVRRPGAVLLPRRQPGGCLAGRPREARRRPPGPTPRRLPRPSRRRSRRPWWTTPPGCAARSSTASAPR